MILSKKMKLAYVLFTVVFISGCYSRVRSAIDGLEEDVPQEQVVKCDVIICTADFPCQFNSICVDSETIVYCRTVPCEEICGTVCCSGGGCESTDRVEICPEGKQCFEHFEYGIGMSEARCLPVSSDAGTDADVIDYDGWHQPEVYKNSCM